MSSSTTTTRGGSVAATLVNRGENRVFVGSESREACQTVHYDTGKEEVYIQREENAKAKSPGLKPELTAKKIYECEKFILAATGDAGISKKIGNSLIKMFTDNEPITEGILIKAIRVHLDELTADDGDIALLLITPEEFAGTDFTIRRIERSGKLEIITQGYACIGCGKDDTLNHIAPDKVPTWDDKSEEATKTLIRDGIYCAADKHRVKVGGDVVVFSSRVEEDKQGNRKFVTYKTVYPPMRDLWKREIDKIDISEGGILIGREWFEKNISDLNWEPEARAKIGKMKQSTQVSVRFYRNIKHKYFYKRPKEEQPQTFETYKMELRTLDKDTLVLGCQEFNRFCNENRIREGKTVYLFWEDETSSFCMFGSTYRL